jgi:hypothetical protein
MRRCRRRRGAVQWRGYNVDNVDNFVFVRYRYSSTTYYCIMARVCERSQPCMSESGHLYPPPLEMESLPAQSPVIGKPHVSDKLARRDYAIGICLLLLVVFLWTTSNFVTQVRLYIIIGLFKFNYHPCACI